MGTTTEIRRQLHPEATCPATARRVVSATLREWGCESLVDTALLLTSEIVTNALVHAEGEIELALQRIGDGRVRVEVCDSSHAVPLYPPRAARATAGRGLALVDALAARWGVQLLDDGKSVWFELAR